MNVGSLADGLSARTFVGLLTAELSAKEKNI